MSSFLQYKIQPDRKFFHFEYCPSGKTDNYHEYPEHLKAGTRDFRSDRILKLFPEKIANEVFIVERNWFYKYQAIPATTCKSFFRRFKVFQRMNQVDYFISEKVFRKAMEDLQANGLITSEDVPKIERLLPIAYTKKELEERAIHEEDPALALYLAKYYGGTHENSYWDNQKIQQIWLMRACNFGAIIEDFSPFRRIIVTDIFREEGKLIREKILDQEIVQEIDLSPYPDFDEEWLKGLSNFIACSQTVKNLNLSRCCITTGRSLDHKLVRILGEGLKKNRSITILHLNENNIEDRGFEIIARSLKENVESKIRAIFAIRCGISNQSAARITEMSQTVYLQ